MMPTLSVGETVQIAKTKPRIGDVFAFRARDGQVIIHRLIARLPGGLLLHCGDSPECRQAGSTKTDRIVGTVSGKPRRVKWRQVILSTIYVTQKIHHAVRRQPFLRIVRTSIWPLLESNLAHFKEEIRIEAFNGKYTSRSVYRGVTSAADDR